jgi:hypothetical protein
VAQIEQAIDLRRMNAEPPRQRRLAEAVLAHRAVERDLRRGDRATPPSSAAPAAATGVEFGACPSYRR